MIRDHLQENENVKPNTAFLEELKNKLPEFFNNNGFDIEKFKNALKENNINEFSEGYQLNFIGKDYARKQAGDAPTSVIVPDNEHNQKEENKNSKNLFFTGNNLEVLRHLRNNYSNKIDVIYIDPPYNTGNDDFVYPDKFEYSDKQLKEFFGMSDVDVSKLDTLKGSKSHSAWLTFMYPRLWLAKQLLADNGVIFISIDDNEQANLRELIIDLFGEMNVLVTVPVINNLKGNQDQLGFAGAHEYVLCATKNIQKVKFNGIPLNADELKEWSKDEKGWFKKGANLKATGINAPRERRPNLYFPVFLMDNGKLTLDNSLGGKEILPITNGRPMSWRWSREKFVDNINDIIVSVNKDSVSLNKKQRPNGQEIPSKKPKSFLYKPSYSSGSGTNEIVNLFGNKAFSYPKPTSFIKDLITIASAKNSTVLDFFAGSATTADAVMQLNAEDGGKRQFIMVQLPEKTYELDKSGNKKPVKGGKAAFDDGYMSIDEISRERIKRAAKKIKDENPDLSEDFDGGFKHYRVVSPEKETLDKIYDFDPERYELVSDVVDSFSSSALGVPGNASGEDTILTTWLAEDGYDFNTDDLVEYDFAGYKAFGIKDTRLYLIDGNLHPEQTKELLNQLGTNKVKFQSIVVYGYSFNVMDMKELERGLSQLNSNVNLIKRY